MTHAVTRQEYDERLKRGWRENGAIRAKGKARHHLVHPIQGKVATVLIQEEVGR